MLTGMVKDLRGGGCGLDIDFTPPFRFLYPCSCTIYLCFSILMMMTRRCEMTFLHLQENGYDR